MANKSSIHLNPKHKGMLHRDLGVPSYQPISTAKLNEAEKTASPAVKKRIVFAKAARKWSH